MEKEHQSQYLADKKRGDLGMALKQCGIAFLAITITATVCSCSDNNKTESKPVDNIQSGQKWYQGGTLDKSTVKEWRMSTFSNKLATSADWSIASKKVKNIVVKSGDVNTARPFAIKLTACIDEATATGLEDSIPEDIETWGLAAGCMLFFGW